MDSLNYTFQSLNEHLPAHLGSAKGLSPSPAPNLVSALNGFMTERGYADPEAIGSILRASYRKNIAAHVEKLTSDGRSAAYIANRKTLLTKWRTVTGVSRNSIRRYLAAYRDGGCAQLLGRKPMAKMADDPQLKEALFLLLHEPPSLSGVNRATWKLEEVRRVLTGRGFAVDASVIRQVIRAGGFRWKSAKVVLTSHDPEYREKLTQI